MPNQGNRATQLHQRIRAILLSEWDPIGIGGASHMQDEYDSYVPALYKMLIGGVPEEEVVEYLWWVETEHMMLCGDRQATERIAKLLFATIDPDHHPNY